MGIGSSVGSSMGVDSGGGAATPTTPQTLPQPQQRVTPSQQVPQQYQGTLQALGGLGVGPYMNAPVAGGAGSFNPSFQPPQLRSPFGMSQMPSQAQGTPPWMNPNAQGQGMPFQQQALPQQRYQQPTQPQLTPGAGQAWLDQMRARMATQLPQQAQTRNPFTSGQTPGLASPFTEQPNMQTYSAIPQVTAAYGGGRGRASNFLMNRMARGGIASLRIRSGKRK